MPFHILKSFALALGLFSVHGAAAQYVQVPTGTGCVVVVAGTGGNIALNRVGDGGIVAMSDPFDVSGAGGNFTFSGGTPLQWTLLGDISEQTSNVPPTAPDQSAGGVAVVNIESYNKSVRNPSETTAPSTSLMARSKGRVSILWDSGTCKSVLSFDILKKWGGYAPKVIGPNCWGTGLITFSVDQVISDNGLDAIGFDQYYWKLTNGIAGAPGILTSSAYYTSADRSSITIDQSSGAFNSWLTANPTPVFTIQVCYGRCNPWDGGTAISQVGTGTTCETKTICPAPAAPTYSPVIPTCVPTATTSIGPFLTTNLPGHTYAWNVPCAWTVATSGPANEDLTITGMDGNSCTISLTVTGPCGSTTYFYPIRRTFATNLLAPTPVCVSSPGSFTATLPSTALNNLTCWTALPAGWTFGPSNAPNNSTRVINVPLGVAAGTYTITAFNCSCPGNTSITVNVRPATPVFSPAPTTCVDLGTAYTYTALTPGTFTWTHPGWTGPTTGTSVSLTPTIAPPGTISITRDGQPGCSSLPLTVTPVQKPVVTQPCLNRGAPTPNALFTCSPGGAGTTWSFGAGLVSGGVFNTTGSPANGAGGFTVLGTPGTYACSVTTNGCTTNFNVAVSASTYTLATPNETDPLVTTLQATFNATTLYQLFDCSTGLPAPPGTWILGSAGGGTAALSGAGPGSFAFNCDPAPAGGCIERTNCQTTVHKSLPTSGSGEVGSVTFVEKAVVVSPNPNDGIFNVSITHVFEQGSATLFDAQGRCVMKAMRLVPGPNQVRTSNLAPGVYTLRTEVDGEVEQQSIVVAKE